MDTYVFTDKKGGRRFLSAIELPSFLAKLFMSKGRKRVRAVNNSQSYQGQTYYYGHSGRVYQSDPKFPAPSDGRMSEKQIRQAKLKMHMSMTELKRMEIFLETGERKKKTSVSAKEKERLVSEYGLKINPASCQYESDLDTVWQILCEKFPNRSKNYKNYTQCQYALRYGEASVTIIQPAKK